MAKNNKPTPKDSGKDISHKSISPKAEPSSKPKSGGNSVQDNRGGRNPRQVPPQTSSSQNSSVAPSAIPGNAASSTPSNAIRGNFTPSPKAIPVVADYIERDDYLSYHRAMVTMPNAVDMPVANRFARMKPSDQQTFISRSRANNNDIAKTAELTFGDVYVEEMSEEDVERIQYLISVAGSDSSRTNYDNLGWIEFPQSLKQLAARLKLLGYLPEFGNSLIQIQEAALRLEASNEAIRASDEYIDISEVQLRARRVRSLAKEITEGVEVASLPLDEQIEIAFGYQLSTTDNDIILDKFLQANLEYIEYLNSLGLDGVEFVRRVLADNTGTEIVFDADDKTGGGYYGFVPLPASTDNEDELTKVYLGSQVSISTMAHELAHQIDRYFTLKTGIALSDEVNPAGLNQFLLTTTGNNVNFTAIQAGTILLARANQTELSAEVLADIVMNAILAGKGYRLADEVGVFTEENQNLLVGWNSESSNTALTREAVKAFFTYLLGDAP